MSVDGLRFEDAWPNRQESEIGTQRAWFIGRLDLIKNKRASGRHIDLHDAEPIGDFGPSRVARHIQIVVSLEVYPKLGCGSKIPCQTKGRVRGNSPSAANDVIDASHRHLQFDSESVG
jgi:hypothetical protein